MRIVGVDLSLTATGVAVIPDALNATDAHVATIKSKGTRSDSLIERRNRLCWIRSRVFEYTDGAELVVVEGPAYGANNSGTWDRAGLWWTLVNGLMNRDRCVVEVPPTSRAKYATGKGNAGKDEVLAAVVRRYPQVEVTNNNEADALILAAMGARAYGLPIGPALDARRLEALEKIAWPGR